MTWSLAFVNLPVPLSPMKVLLASFSNESPASIGLCVFYFPLAEWLSLLLSLMPEL